MLTSDDKCQDKAGLFVFLIIIIITVVIIVFLVLIRCCFPPHTGPVQRDGCLSRGQTMAVSSLHQAAGLQIASAAAAASSAAAAGLILMI